MRHKNPWLKKDAKILTIGRAKSRRRFCLWAAQCSISLTMQAPHHKLPMAHCQRHKLALTSAYRAPYTLDQRRVGKSLLNGQFHRPIPSFTSPPNTIHPQDLSTTVLSFQARYYPQFSVLPPLDVNVSPHPRNHVMLTLTFQHRHSWQKRTTRRAALHVMRRRLPLNKTTSGYTKSARCHLVLPPDSRQRQWAM